MVTTDTLHEVFTYEQMLEELPTESCFELIDSQLFEMPAPSTNHQIIQSRITRVLDNLIFEKQLGLVFSPVFDVIFSRYDVVQPDVTFISTENLPILQERGCFGTPDLIVEIVSPSTVVRDYYEKRNLYERYGVKEYWIIDPAHKTLSVLSLKNEKLVELIELVEEGEAGSILVPDFKIQLSSLFNGLVGGPRYK